MAWLALGFCLFALFFAAGRLFVSLSPASLARALRTFVAAFGVLAGTGLLMLGRFGLAVVAIAAAATAIRSLVLEHRPPGTLGGGAGQDRVEVETAWLAMRLDKATGQVEGTVRRGSLAGQSLASLAREALIGLLAELAREDPPSVTLLEAYLDRRFPDWRSAAGEAGGSGSAPVGGDSLDERTALEILGLEPGATPDEIKAAHRRLMSRLHPDRGGSTWIASRLNAAKDLLLRARG